MEGVPKGCAQLGWGISIMRKRPLSTERRVSEKGLNTQRSGTALLFVYQFSI
jgi:hypothetical protein